MSSRLQRLRQALLTKYLIGGATWLLIVGLFGSTIYNGLWDDDNKWRNLRFGRQRTVHDLAVGIIVLSIFAFLAVLGGLLVTIFLQTLKLAELICWVFGYSLTLIVIILQGCSLSYTVYSAQLVQDEYNYLEHYPTFKKYVDDYGSKEAYLLHGFYWGAIPAIRAAANKSALEANWFKVADPEAFRVSYRENSSSAKYAQKSVISCAFDWGNLAAGDKLKGNPCDFAIEDGDAVGCIGAWTGSAFKKYWCHLWNEWKDEEEFLKKDVLKSDLQKREAAKLRTEMVIDSLPAFYRHNTYLIGINVTGFVLSGGAVAFDFFFGEKIAEAGAGKSGKAKKNNKLTSLNKGAKEGEGGTQEEVGEGEAHEEP